MKLRNFLSVLVALIILAGCGRNDVIVGPEGPPGPQGPPGADGLLGTVFEYEVNFTAPEYSVLIEFPEDFEIFESDKALVYLLWDITETEVDIWRMLPQTLFTDNGLMQYNFDFTSFDINIFMDADFPLDLLGAGDTDNQVFRVVIVPASFLESARVDFSDYHEVAEMLGLPEFETRRSGKINKN